MIVGHTVLPTFDALWQLANEVAGLLGEAPLIAVGEHATDATMVAWSIFPRAAWRHGRLFGNHGELSWRIYGTYLRAVLILDETEDTCAPLAARMGALQFQDIHRYSAAPEDATREDATIYLWPNGAYTRATVRYYKDSDGNGTFYRYLHATPHTVAAQGGEDDA